jgi:hypothetical protein
MKGISPIIGLALTILLVTSATILIVTVLKPTLDKAKAYSIFNEGIQNLELLNSAIKEVTSEAEGSKRTVSITVSDGEYKINSSYDWLYFEYDPPADLGLSGRRGDIWIERGLEFAEWFNGYAENSLPYNLYNLSGSWKVVNERLEGEKGLAFFNLNKKFPGFSFSANLENSDGQGEVFVSSVNPQNLTLFLTFDEGSGTIAYDFSGNKNNGTLYNGTISCANPPTVGAGCPAWVDGKYGKALSFDGVDDYVNVGNASSLTPTNAITISAWIYPINTTVVVGRIVDKWYSAEAKSSYTLYLENQKVKMAIHTGTSDKYIAGTTTIQKDIWYHVVGTYNGSYVNLYVNGALDATPVSASGSIQTNTGDLNIGRYAYVGTDYFNGTIDEVRIYNKALSEEEIKAEYEAGLKKLSSSGATDFISQPTNVSIVLSNPTGSTLFDDIKIKNQQKKIRLTLFYEKIDLNSTLSISKGIFNLFVEYKGFNETSGRPIIEIRRAE